MKNKDETFINIVIEEDPNGGNEGEIEKDPQREDTIATSIDCTNWEDLDLSVGPKDSQPT